MQARSLVLLRVVVLAVAAELAEVESRLPEDKRAAIDPDGITRQYVDLRETFPALSVFERRRLLQAMVSEFTAWIDGRVEVDFNLLSGMEVTGIALNQFRHIDLRERPEPKSLGEAIKSYRMDLGMTQKELAANLGVNIYTLGQWERNVHLPAKHLRQRVQEQTGLDISSWIPPPQAQTV